LMVPQAVTVIPLYTMLTEVGLRNTFWALVLPQVFGSPFAIFLLREYFRAIPADLLDAARLDGCGTLRTLRHVAVPVSKPILATLTIITVVTHWNNFLWPLVITTGRRWQVLTVATAGLQSQYNGNWTVVTAATTTAILPLLVLFLAFQRHVVRSITITGFR
jgi:multiple sugar transport system permease protein